MTKGVLTDRSHPRRVEILFSLQKEEGDEEEFGNVDKGQLSKDSGGRIVICSFFFPTDSLAQWRIDSCCWGPYLLRLV